jgi:hypothetical protein
LESVSSATVASSSGTVTKTGQFTGDSYGDKLLYLVTDNDYRLIESNTSNVINLVGTAPSSTTQDVAIYDWATRINSIEVYGNNTRIKQLHMNENGVGFGLKVWSSPGAKVYQSNIGRQFRMEASTAQLFSTLISTTGTAAPISMTAAFLEAFYITVKINNDISLNNIFNGSKITMTGSLIDGDAGGGNKATSGILVQDNSSIVFAATNGVTKIKNCDQGVRAQSGGQARGTVNVNYSGNTTNESADAASFGFID